MIFSIIEERSEVRLELPPHAVVPIVQPDVAVEQRAYDAALDQFKGNNFAAAITNFVGFVKAYPKSPLAPSAQYWIGNSHFALRDYRAAIVAQRQLVAMFPDSQKVPAAVSG